MKKLLLCTALLIFFSARAMEEDEAFEGMISFYDAYLSSNFVFSNGVAHCNHYLRGSVQPYVLTLKNAAQHLENAKEQIAKMYEDGNTMRQIENLLSNGRPLNLFGQLALALQAVHQFDVSADLDDSHVAIKKNREVYKNAWMSYDELEVAFASRLPLYPQGEGHIPLTKKIEQLKQELGKK